MKLPWVSLVTITIRISTWLHQVISLIVPLHVSISTHQKETKKENSEIQYPVKRTYYEQINMLVQGVLVIVESNSFSFDHIQLWDTGDHYDPFSVPDIFRSSFHLCILTDLKSTFLAFSKNGLKMYSEERLWS